MSDTYSAPSNTEDDDDTQGAIPTSQDSGPPADGGGDDTTGGGTGTTAPAPQPYYNQEGPFTPEQEQLNTREKALDKSGLGGAFGAAQHAKIADARSALVQQLIQHGLAGSGQGPQPGETEDLENNGAIPTGQEPTAQGGVDAGPAGRAVQAVGNAIAAPFQKAAAGYAAGWQRLLSGQGAMPHAVAETVAASTNPDGSNPTETLDALHKATERGGPDTGVAFMQNRVGVYDAARGWAAAAYDGKNLSAAIDAANRAYKNLPLAEQVKFSTGPNGSVTATVSGANEGDQPISYALPSANFRELMRGKSGFAYDILMQGPNAVLSKLTSEDHGVNAPADSQGVAPGPNGKVTDDLKALGVNQALYNQGFALYPWQGQDAKRQKWFAQQVQDMRNQEQDEEYNQPNAGRLTDAEVAEHNRRHYPIYQAPQGVDQDLYDQARRLFPSVNQDRQREAWISGQQSEKAGLQNKIEIAKQQGVNRRDVAETQAGGRQNVANTQVQGRLTQEGMRGETRTNVENIKQENANERTNVRAGAVDRATLARLKIASDALKSKERTELERVKGRERDTVLSKITAGMSAEDTDAMLKKAGTSLNELLGSSAGTPQGGGSAGQQAPKAGAGISPVKGAPAVGTVKGGYQYNGGPPGDAASWSKVQ
jgi:hypothetical protein